MKYVVFFNIQDYNLMIHQILKEVISICYSKRHFIISISLHIETFYISVGNLFSSSEFFYAPGLFQPHGMIQSGNIGMRNKA